MPNPKLATEDYRLIDNELFNSIYSFLQKKAKDGDELKQQADLCVRMRQAGSMKISTIELKP